MKENTTKLIKLCFYEQKQTYIIIIFQKYLHNTNIYINFATKTIHI